MSTFEQTFWHTHAHSHFSVSDALHSVPEMVAKAAQLGQPAMAITDHGTMGGSFQLYNECTDHGIAPFPGVEAYLVRNIDQARHQKDKQRWHVGLLALDYTGYAALVRLVTRSYTPERHYIKPLIDFADLAELHASGASQHLALTTGCYFGLPIQELVRYGPERAKAVLQTYAAWFPHTYVELQNHGTDHGDGWNDWSVSQKMAELAWDLGLPVIITGDCHYLDEDHHAAHGMMKELAYQGEPGEDSFPGDSYHLCDAAWVTERFPDVRILNEAASSYQDLLDHHALKIPALDSYQFLMPSVHPQPDAELLRQVKAGLQDRAAHLVDTHTAYIARAKAELDTIAHTGFADYFLLVADVCAYARQHDIRIQARGSANGSLVCWLLGITDIDPIRWDLTMDGFLTRDRAKPPDIDLDTQTFRRAELITYVEHRFRCIQQGAPNSWSWSPEDGKGSLFLQWKNLQRRRLPEEDFVRRFGRITTLEEIEAVDKATHDKLAHLAEIKPWRSFGTHAAGFVLDSQLQPLDELVPTQVIASSGKVVTQMTMDDLENAGLVKLDVLGLRTLESLDVTRQVLGWSWADFEAIPFDDAEVMRRIGQGRVGNGTFQLEGWTMANGVRQMQPRDIHEIIQAAAVFRPACIEAGATEQFLRHRLAPQHVTYPAPVAEVVLKDTWGVFIFTEQVLELCAALGLDVLTTQAILKAMKVKHGKKGYNPKSEAAFQAAREQFLDTCRAQCQPSEGEALWDAIYGFNRYGFKKAHATPYGILGYRTAWLACHHPKEFWLGVLDVVNRMHQGPKEASYMAAARQAGMVLHAPRIRPGTVVQPGWTIVADGLQQGVATVKGVGTSAAAKLAEAGPVGRLEDLEGYATGWSTWRSTGSFTGTMRTLQEAGVLTPLGLKPGQTRQPVLVRLVAPPRLQLQLPDPDATTAS